MLNPSFTPRAAQFLAWLTGTGLATFLLAFITAPAPVRSQPAGRSDIYGDPLPAGALARMGTLRLRHGGRVSAVAFLRDGKTLVSGGADRTLRIWDAATGREVRRLSGHKDSVETLAVDPGGSRLISGGRKCQALIWDLASGRLLHTLAGDGSTIRAVTFNPAGDAVAVYDGTWIRLWCPVTGRPTRDLLSSTLHQARCLAFSPDGKMLASGDHRSGEVLLWNITTGKVVWRAKVHSGAVLSVGFLPDGKTLLSAGEDGTLLAHRPGQAGVPRTLLRGAPQAQGARAVLSPDGRTLAWPDNHGNGSVRLIEVSTGKVLRRLTGHVHDVEDVAFAPDGKTLASAGWDGTVRLWDVTTGKERLASRGYAWRVTAALSPDGNSVACASGGAFIALCEPGSGREVRRLPLGPWPDHATVDLVAFRPDGKTLVCASGGHALWLWDLEAGKQLCRTRIAGLGGAVGASADGRCAAVGRSDDGPVRLLSPESGKELARINRVAATAAFSPEGNTVAVTGNWDGWVYFYDTRSGKKLRRLHADEDRAGFITFSPTGGVLATGGSGRDGVVACLWQCGAGGPSGPLELKGPGGPAQVLAFSPDGRTLVVAGQEDGAIRLWEAASGKERGLLRGHQGLVWSLVFSKDGRLLLSGSEDTTALLWDVPGHALLRPPAGAKPAALWDDLGSEDAARAYRAVWALAGMPEKAVPHLRDRLRPAPAAEPGRVARLLAELNSDSFPARQKAHAELEALGEAARPGLVKAAKAPPSAEVGRQLRQLLQRLERQRTAPSGEPLRALRAVETLEYAGTTEARKLLAKLAGGAPEARLTREAKASLGRLERRAAGSRP